MVESIIFLSWVSVQSCLSSTIRFYYSLHMLFAISLVLWWLLKIIVGFYWVQFSTDDDGEAWHESKGNTTPTYQNVKGQISIISQHQDDGSESGRGAFLMSTGILSPYHFVPPAPKVVRKRWSVLLISQPQSFWDLSLLKGVERSRWQCSLPNKAPL